MGYKTVATGTGDVQIVTSPVRLIGYSVFESAGTPAAASLTLRDGTSTAGTPVVSVELAQNTSETRTLGGNGVLVGGGIFLDRTSGETTVTIWFE